MAEQEVLGDGYDEEKIQFEPCKYNPDKKEIEPEKHGYGYRELCKYMDNYGNCIFENCMYDQEETPPTTDNWWFTCVICQQPDTIDPKNMKIHWCKSCIDRANEAEVLPFTCRYCGRKQNHPSKWFMSRVCDRCEPKLYNPNCHNYTRDIHDCPRGHHPHYDDD